jgi:peptidoglycan/xylan/chitin deacetylase (PgdA/CDA1 family)
MKSARLLAVALIAALGPIASVPAQTSPRPAALFTYVFDDGFSTDAVVASVFAARGAVACSAVTTGWIGTEDHLTAADIRQLQDQGWEILSHTRTHPHLPRLSAAGIEEELRTSREELESLGVTVHSLVYPYNQSNAEVERIARGYYRSARGGGDALNTSATDPYALRSFSNRHNPDALRRIIDRAYAAHAWLIVYQHRVDVDAAIEERQGRFLPDEMLEFSPSLAEARCEKSAWSEVLGTLHYRPLRGAPRPGDFVTGQKSHATAKIGHIVFDDFAIIAGVLDYLGTRYPDMKIVTIDQGLDLLGIP